MQQTLIPAPSSENLAPCSVITATLEQLVIQMSEFGIPYLPSSVVFLISDITAISVGIVEDTGTEILNGIQTYSPGITKKKERLKVLLMMM